MSHSSSAAEEISAPAEHEKTRARDFLDLELGGNLWEKEGFIMEDFEENIVASTLRYLDIDMVDILFRFRILNTMLLRNFRFFFFFFLVVLEGDKLSSFVIFVVILGWSGKRKNVQEEGDER